MKKPRPLKPFEQLPDPEWASDLADGKPEKAKRLLRDIDQAARAFGADAGDFAHAEMKTLAGRALLKKVERDSPAWDGRTRVMEPSLIQRLV